MKPALDLQKSEVRIPHGKIALEGELTVPAQSIGLVLFAHGSGSSRHSPRNQAVAAALQEKRLATLLFDLLTEPEEQAEMRTRHLRFNIPLLAERLVSATRWASTQKALSNLRVGYFGSSTGAAAALMAAAELEDRIAAVVSRGGRPDLAGDALASVTSPTLLIVGGRDEAVIDLNESALEKMRCETKIQVVEGATHLFEEPGALERVSQLAADWFSTHLQAARSGP